MNLLYTNNKGYKFKILRYNSCMSVVVRFEDGYEEVTTRMDHIRTGCVKSMLSPSVEGVGFVGVGGFSVKGCRDCYGIWQAMLRRCYNPFITSCPTYEGTLVDIDWHNFQNFAEFYYADKYRQEGWCIDKDILSTDQKMYSAATCVFVPHEVNNSIISCTKARGEYKIGVWFDKKSSKFRSSLNISNGDVKQLGSFNNELSAFLAYKQAKEEYMQSLGNKWAGLVDDRVVAFLMNYTVLDDHKGE